MVGVGSTASLLPQLQAPMKLSESLHMEVIEEYESESYLVRCPDLKELTV